MQQRDKWYHDVGTTMPSEPEESTPRERLLELALLFFRLGLTAFGGPAAHIAMMKEEVVTRRKWLSADEFLDLLGATNLIPGPNSTEMAIHIGRKRAGALGLVVAGLCFIVPAVLVTLVFAWIYVRWGTIPRVASALYGIKPVMIAVVLHAVVDLVKTAAKTKILLALGIAAAIAVILGASEIGVLVATGVAAVLLHASPPQDDSKTSAYAIVPAFGTSVWAATASPGSLFFVFAKIGSVLFGSGYVLLAFLRADLVEQRHWLTEKQLLDAIAVGQVTPGPVFTTATFIGYLVHGLDGAAAATAGIFAPAFVFVAATGFLVPRLRASPRASRFLDGVNVASLALMAVVTVHLGRAALVDATTIAIAIVAAAVLYRWKTSSFWLIVAGALIGALS